MNPSTVSEIFTELRESKKVEEALAFIKTDHENTVAEQITITEIPAPPFKEQIRAEDLLKRLKDLQLEDVQMDAEGNVFGVRRGTGGGPTLFVSAHLDTVFPEGTDTAVKEEGGILYAPGVGDDTRGLAELLSLVRAFQEADIQHKGDIIFGGTVGEEGAGNLRGVKAFFDQQANVDGYISIDGPDWENIIYLGTGSYRFTVTYKGPGGHSFGNFGEPSATHALGRAIAAIAELRTKEEPRTTFTVGEVSGGTSVNAIAAEASMTVDLRSNDKGELQGLANHFLTIVQAACDAENQRWNSDKLTVEIDQFGDRPSASQSAVAAIVQASSEAIRSLGGQPELVGPSSTDANYPMSLGIPAVTSGTGGKAGGAHTLGEWYDPANGYVGVQKHLLLILGLIGVDGVSEALLEQR
ncbi:M20/M25/M40 family metallo-hydrolase [Lentibacillus sediminis]|uniref:M20/M25/M40 family metallo-hydrolase n=1 Tax=Lentibacillus sediminis TaxID=1940529 RepID=UPI000C1C82C5|nr:M20/M25/M40 family metallo-hydrolase [Lentibacillus sediminis]